MSIHTCVCVYLYAHIFIHIFTCVYFRIHTESQTFWVRNVSTEFITILFDLVQTMFLVLFSYLHQLSNFYKSPRNMRKFLWKCYSQIAGGWECAVYGSRPPIAWKPGSSPPERLGLDNITGQPWSDATCPRTISSSDLSCLREKNVAIGINALKDMVRGQGASDHGPVVILSRPLRSGGDEPGFEAIGSWEHKQHTFNTRTSC